MSERILKPNRRHLHALPRLDDGQPRGPRSTPRTSRRSQMRGRLCSRGHKIRYPDHEAAVAALHRAEASRSLSAADGVDCCRRERRAYDCSSCRGWHLTSWDTWSQPEEALTLAG